MTMTALQTLFWGWLLCLWLILWGKDQVKREKERKRERERKKERKERKKVGDGYYAYG